MEETPPEEIAAESSPNKPNDASTDASSLGHTSSSGDDGQGPLRKYGKSLANRAVRIYLNLIFVLLVWIGVFASEFLITVLVDWSLTEILHGAPFFQCVMFWAKVLLGVLTLVLFLIHSAYRIYRLMLFDLDPQHKEPE